MSVEFSICEELPKKPIVVEAFPSKGYVSSIAAFYLIKEAGFKQIGSIKASGLENFVVVHEGEVMRPIRIYAKDNIILVFSEIIILPSLVAEFTEKFSGWLREINASQVVLLASILGVEVEDEHKIFGLATTKDLKDKLKDIGVEELKEGVLTGLSSTLALNCNEEGIPSISLLVETPYIPDALAAASLLEILSKLLKIDVDVGRLRETGKQFEEKFQNMVKQLNKSQQDYHDLGSHGMYR
jgi:uncharacterized protein